MFRKRLAVAFVPLFIITGIGGTVFADNPTPQKPVTSEKAPKAELNDTFSVLHAVSQWSVNLSSMADKQAKSDLVKSFAKDVVTKNTDSGAKLLTMAKEEGIEVRPLDPQTEQGKSLIDRGKAEAALLSSLEGDAFDKEYMTLVTNTQQSVINVLNAKKASAKDEDVKKYLGDMTTTVQKRLKTAQDIMAKVYGNTI